jgi:hypothetical protein
VAPVPGHDEGHDLVLGAGRAPARIAAHEAIERATHWDAFARQHGLPHSRRRRTASGESGSPRRSHRARFARARSRGQPRRALTRNASPMRFPARIRGKRSDSLGRRDSIVDTGRSESGARPALVDGRIRSCSGGPTRGRGSATARRTGHVRGSV